MTGRDGGHAELFGDAQLLVVFDGWCGVCTRLAVWLERRSPCGALRTVPYQHPGLLEALDLTRQDAARQVWAIDRHGVRFGGAAGINRALAELSGWCWIARAYGVPGFRWLEDRGYRWFGRHRARFATLGTQPACARPGERCTDD